MHLTFQTERFSTEALFLWKEWLEVCKEAESPCIYMSCVHIRRLWRSPLLRGSTTGKPWTEWDAQLQSCASRSARCASLSVLLSDVRNLGAGIFLLARSWRKAGARNMPHNVPVPRESLWRKTIQRVPAIFRVVCGAIGILDCSGFPHFESVGLVGTLERKKKSRSIEQSIRGVPRSAKRVSCNVWLFFFFKGVLLLFSGSLGRGLSMTEETDQWLFAFCWAALLSCFCTAVYFRKLWSWEQVTLINKGKKKKKKI